MPLIRLVTSEVKLTLRSTALMTILLVATRVCAWVALANSARAAAVAVTVLCMVGFRSVGPLLDENGLGQFQIAGGQLWPTLAQPAQGSFQVHVVRLETAYRWVV